MPVFMKWFKSLRTKASEYCNDYWKKQAFCSACFRSKLPNKLSVFGSNHLLCQKQASKTKKQASLQNLAGQRATQRITLKNTHNQILTLVKHKFHNKKHLYDINIKTLYYFNTLFTLCATEAEIGKSVFLLWRFAGCCRLTPSLSPAPAAIFFAFAQKCKGFILQCSSSCSK